MTAHLIVLASDAADHPGPWWVIELAHPEPRRLVIAARTEADAWTLANRHGAPTPGAEARQVPDIAVEFARQLATELLDLI